MMRKKLLGKKLLHKKKEHLSKQKIFPLIFLLLGRLFILLHY